MARKERSKTQGRQVMHNTTAQHPLSNAQPTPSSDLWLPSQVIPVCILSMTSHGLEYPFDPFGPASLAVVPLPVFVHLLTSRAGKRKSPDLATTKTAAHYQQHYCHNESESQHCKLLRRKLTLFH